MQLFGTIIYFCCAHQAARHKAKSLLGLACAWWCACDHAWSVRALMMRACIHIRFIRWWWDQHQHATRLDTTRSRRSKYRHGINAVLVSYFPGFSVSPKKLQILYLRFSVWPTISILLLHWYLFYFLFDLLNTAAENAALASKSQTKIGVRPCTDKVFCEKNTKNTFV